MKMNFELLKDLYCVHSFSGTEEMMITFIESYVGKHIPSAIVEKDESGNLFITKGVSEHYPCLCAHMDQVQEFHPDDFMCIDDGGVIFGYSPSMRSQCGLGADDKNGIFIALECLKKYDVLKCAFFVGEEIGCVGSCAADISFFADCRYCIQIDRRGNSDMVTAISNKICSDEFAQDTDYESWGYNVSVGLITDVDVLRGNGVNVSCINLSCGYYKPHTSYEFTVKEDVVKCFNFVCHIIESCTDVYLFMCDYGSYRGYSYDSDDADFDYDALCNEISYFFLDNPGVTFEEVYDYAKIYYKGLTKNDIRKAYESEKERYD